jgi:hypothetical protein
VPASSDAAPTLADVDGLVQALAAAVADVADDAMVAGVA